MVIELAAALAGGSALLLAFAALSWTAVQGLTLVIPSWSASLVVAAAWAVVAGLLLRIDHRRQLLRRLSQTTNEQNIESAERDRSDADEAVKMTAEHLGRAVARETAARELEAGASAAQRLLGTAEHDAEDMLRELIVALGAEERA